MKTVIYIAGAWICLDLLLLWAWARLPRPPESDC